MIFLTYEKTTSLTLGGVISNFMAHIHELIDWTVSVFIVCDDRVLLRMHEKYHQLLAVGGHVELAEDPAAAAVRECREEVGLDIVIHESENLRTYLDGRFRELPRPAAMNIHYINDTHQHCDLVYYATANSMDIIPESPTDTWEWLTAAEITHRTDILPDIKIQSLQALATYASN